MTVKVANATSNHSTICKYLLLLLRVDGHRKNIDNSDVICSKVATCATAKVTVSNFMEVFIKWQLCA